MNVDQEKAQLLRRDAEWASLASEGQDLEAILSYWAEDAMVFQPDLPVVAGKPALRGYVEQSLKIPGFRISWESTDATLSPGGKLAYLVGTNSVTMDGPDGKPITADGRVVTIWRREADGQWRCVIDIWNDGPAA